MWYERKAHGGKYPLERIDVHGNLFNRFSCFRDGGASRKVRRVQNVGHHPLNTSSASSEVLEWLISLTGRRFVTDGNISTTGEPLTFHLTALSGLKINRYSA